MYQHHCKALVIIIIMINNNIIIVSTNIALLQEYIQCCMVSSYFLDVQVLSKNQNGITLSALDQFKPNQDPFLLYIIVEEVIITIVFVVVGAVVGAVVGVGVVSVCHTPYMLDCRWIDGSNSAYRYGTVCYTGRFAQRLQYSIFYAIFMMTWLSSRTEKKNSKDFK